MDFFFFFNNNHFLNTCATWSDLLSDIVTMCVLGSHAWLVFGRNQIISAAPGPAPLYNIVRVIKKHNNNGIPSTCLLPVV